MFRNDNRKGVRLGVSHTPCAVGVVGNYFTSSKLAATDYQRLTEALVQIRNAISILNVINQQISRSIRVMLFLFYLVLFYIFLSFIGTTFFLILRNL